MTPESSLIRKIDCVRIPVPDLDLGLNFYRDSLGHQLIWRTDTSIGLKIPESEAELVIHTEPDEFEVDFKVNSVISATEQFKDAGGKIISGPFDIPIGKCVVVKDPWDNKFILLDSSKGTYKTDLSGKVIGLNSDEKT